MFKFLKSGNAKYFSFYFRRLKHRIPILLAISTVTAFLDGLGLALFIPLFQIAEAGESASETLGNLAFIVDFFENAGVELTISNLLVFMLLLFAFKALVVYISGLYSNKIGVTFMKDTRISLIEKICDISYSGFVNIDQGRIQNVITSEIGKAVGAFSAFLATIMSAIMVVGYLTLAFLSNFQFALLITIAGVLSNFIFRIINKKVETASLMQSLLSNGLQGRILEAIFNYKYLKATDLITKYRTKLVDFISEAEKLSLRMGKLGAISVSIREPIIMLFICAIIFVQVVYMGVSIMTMALSLMFFMRSLTGLISVQTSWQQFLSGSGGVRTTDALYEEFRQNIESEVHNEIGNFNDNIQFENVTFSYAPHLPIVLNNINLTIKKNQTVAFVGESGSGKTTIVNMIAGLFSPVTGQIKIDGISLTPSLVRSFRQQLGYITQEPVVFNDTVFNNVTFHEPINEITMDRFRKALEKTTLTSMVENLPKKETSLLGDNGVLISGGQKQRISIARELYRDCSVLLMDEATSALDTENEIIIQSNINELKGKYTIIIVAHRLSTVKNADVIYLIDKGKIEAYGNFDELYNISPRFKKMVELQEFS